MQEPHLSAHSLPRRSLLKSAGLGLGAGFLSGVAPAAAAEGEVRGRNTGRTKAM